MGRRGSWFASVKKVFVSEPKGKTDQKARKSKKWFRKRKDSDAVPLAEETKVAIPEPSPPPPPPIPSVEDVNLTKAEDEQSKHAYSVAVATAKAAEAAVAAAHAAAEVVRLTTIPLYSGMSREEIASIKIQTAFRGYLARRALHALRGLVRLKTLVQGPTVKRQAANTLRYMQTLAHVQSQIRARRIRMSEENRDLQQQLQQKRERELEKLKASIGEEWDDSTKSKEQIEARLQSKQEAAMRRERALAYAYSHQLMWKKSSKSANPTFMDPNNPHWGWSWLERWMAARPWETQSAIDSSDQASMKSTASRKHDGRPSPVVKRLSYPPSRQSPSTPSKAMSSSSSVNMNIKSASPKKSGWVVDEDSRSFRSVRSERYRRHSIGGSSVGDNDSLASSPSVPSYMAPTQAAKARSKLPSPLGMANGSIEKESVGSAKKRLSFPASPAGSRRHSVPPRVDVSSFKDSENHMEENVSNAGGR